MTFLTIEDFQTRINPAILSQITNDDDTMLDNAELQALGIINDMLSGNFNLTTELAKTHTSRHQTLVGWMLTIACYYLYAAIPDNEVPERIVKDYDDAWQSLRLVASGKQPTTLTSVTVDGVEKRVFRMGSNTARQHNML